VHATRASRRAARERQPRRRWISEHETVITATLQRLLRECARLGLRPEPSPEPSEDPRDQEDPRITDGVGGGVDGEVALGDYLTWLADDLTGDAVTEGTFGALGLALGELRGHPVVAARPANHGIHQVIRAADRLRADYASLNGLGAGPAGDAHLADNP
ncbi:MAG: hypothetical protein ACRDT4_18485, partial [Micromonosporaceae bacterium]